MLADFHRAGCGRIGLVERRRLDPLEAAEIPVLLLPNSQQSFDFARLKFGQRHSVVRAVADDARLPLCGAITINAAGPFQVLRSVYADARMVVIEDERPGVILVAPAADARVAGTEVTVRYIRRECLVRVIEHFTIPRAILTVRGDDDPLLAQRVPAFFPSHRSRDGLSTKHYANILRLDCRSRGEKRLPSEPTTAPAPPILTTYAAI